MGIKKQSEEREVPGTQTIFIGTNDIKQIYEKLKPKVEMYKDLQEYSSGKEFSILDPDEIKCCLFRESNQIILFRLFD